MLKISGWGKSDSLSTAADNSLLHVQVFAYHWRTLSQKPCVLDDTVYMLFKFKNCKWARENTMHYCPFAACCLRLQLPVLLFL